MRGYIVITLLCSSLCSSLLVACSGRPDNSGPDDPGESATEVAGRTTGDSEVDGVRVTADTQAVRTPGVVVKAVN
ncbi:MAG: hypothetical protein LBG44_04425 [Gemmatimonadota bacterium]|nr:hypothetical protein [Gemmatimonadota bacterium]